MKIQCKYDGINRVQVCEAAPTIGPAQRGMATVSCVAPPVSQPRPRPIVYRCIIIPAAFVLHSIVLWHILTLHIYLPVLGCIERPLPGSHY